VVEVVAAEEEAVAVVDTAAVVAVASAAVAEVTWVVASAEVASAEVTWAASAEAARAALAAVTRPVMAGSTLTTDDVTSATTATAMGAHITITIIRTAAPTEYS
jgi:hypothetical protein